VEGHARGGISRASEPRGKSCEGLTKYWLSTEDVLGKSDRSSIRAAVTFLNSTLISLSPESAWPRMKRILIFCPSLFSALPLADAMP
jgi:hypothetical protein